MAIKLNNIFPVDEQPRNAVGVAFPFTQYAVSGSATPFKSNFTTRDQLKSNLVVYFSTSKGERPLNPNYGGGLKDLLFEPLGGNINEIAEKKIRDNLAIDFPQVNLQSLEIFQNPEMNQLLVVMRYITVNNEEDTLEINFNA
jgi:phage baseplate assembly protein W